MVRLKDERVAGCVVLYKHFNSTMVRLKVKTEEDIIEFILFQFHYGTIKREGDKKEAVTRLYFNSTMVRLKALAAEEDYKQQIFQFHYGTIKSGH